jgi:flagellar hook-length control protein FliK
MSEQLLNGLLGNITAKELPFAMASNKAENPLQANLGEESFGAKLAHLAENMSSSLRVKDSSESATNKQVPTSIEPEPTLPELSSALSNQADINFIMEMISKGILPDIDGLREQLSQIQILNNLNNNTNKEAFVTNGINYTSDGKPTLLHTLLNGKEILTLAKAMQNGGDVSILAKATQNGGDVSTLAKAMQNGGEISTLAKATQNGEEVSTLAKAMQNSEEVSSSTKAIQNGEDVSTLAKAMQNSEEVLTLAKAMQNSEEASSLAKPRLSGAKPVRSGSDVSSLATLTESTKLKSKEISSTAKSMKDGKAISSVAKTTGGGEEVPLPANNPANDMNSQDLRDNPNNRINGQLASQHANKTVPEESNPNLSEVEDSELHPALNASKSQDVTTSFNDNTRPDNDSSDGLINKSTASQDNSFFNNQNSDTAKESNLNPVNNKPNNNQSIEPKMNFANVARQINVARPFESLGVDLADNFIQRARLFMQGGKSTIRLQLNPPELGSLKLEFTVEDDVLSAKIFVERSSVKDIIEKDIPRLRELIANTEVDVGKFDVFLQEKEDERLGFMDKDRRSDSESEHTQELTDQEREGSDSEVDEELELNIVNSNSSNRVNYFA